MVLNKDEIEQAVLEYAKNKYGVVYKDNFEFVIEYAPVNIPEAYTANLNKPMPFAQIQITNLKAKINEI